MTSLKLDPPKISGASTNAPSHSADNFDSLTLPATSHTSGLTPLHMASRLVTASLLCSLMQATAGELPHPSQSDMVIPDTLDVIRKDDNLQHTLDGPMDDIVNLLLDQGWTIFIPGYFEPPISIGEPFILDIIINQEYNAAELNDPNYGIYNIQTNPLTPNQLLYAQQEFYTVIPFNPVTDGQDVEGFVCNLVESMCVSPDSTCEETLIDPGTYRHQPEYFQTFSVYPNPFNPSTQFTFTLPAIRSLDLSLYTLNGELVYETNYAHLPAGRHSIPFHAENLASGSYFARFAFSTGQAQEVHTERVVLLR